MRGRLIFQGGELQIGDSPALGRTSSTSGDKVSFSPLWGINFGRLSPASGLLNTPGPRCVGEQSAAAGMSRLDKPPRPQLSVFRN